MSLLKQSSTAQPLLFLLVDSTDKVTGKTGLSPTVTLSKNGGSFAAPSGAVTEIANGWYKVAGNATDTNTLGPLVLHATGTAADPVDVKFEVVAFDPQDSVRMGQTALPNAAAGANGGLPVLSSSATALAYAVGSVTSAVTISAGTGIGQLDFTSGRIKADVVYWRGDEVALPDTAGYPSVTIKSGFGSGEIYLVGGAVASVGTIAAINGTIGTFDALQTALNTAHGAGSWATATGFSTHSASDVWAVGTRTLTAGTNIVLPSNALGNISAWTVNLTGNITGNLSGSVGSVTAGVTVSTITGLTIADVQSMATGFLTMIEDDGAGGEQFTTLAMENAPTSGGGGGGGTDWTANERTAIRAILGIPGSGTTPATPTTGALADILAKTDLISTSTLEVISPVSAAGDAISLIQGDDYFAADGRALSFSNEDWPSLIGATARLKIEATTFTMEIVSASELRLELTDTQTSALFAGARAFVVEATLANGHEVTLVTGTATVTTSL